MTMTANAGRSALDTNPVRRSRVALAGLAVFVLSQVCAVVVHGFLLAADYEPFEGTLLRANTSDPNPAWQFVFLPVVHLSFTVGLIWLFVVARADAERWVSRALTLGVVSYLIGPGPMFLLWYAQQPWPGALAVKQLGYELVIALMLAITAGAILRKNVGASDTDQHPTD
ncbi:MAG TPA: hypothetical protein VGF24_07635 [Vicinamibacterales bacterium]|jgi:hypothetical protein